MTDKTYTLAEQKENRKKWVKALRSGRYKQGKGCLRDVKSDAHCCLGVGCRATRIPSTRSSDLYHFGKEKKSGTAPIELVRATGLLTTNGCHEDTSLINLNDGDNLTFSQIADIIESEPKGLFRESVEDA